MNCNINAAEFEIERKTNAIEALTEHNRLLQLENEQLAMDKAELVNWLNVISDEIECYGEMLEINKVKLVKLMKKHKCD